MKYQLDDKYYYRILTTIEVYYREHVEQSVTTSSLDSGKMWEIKERFFQTYIDAQQHEKFELSYDDICYFKEGIERLLDVINEDNDYYNEIIEIRDYLSNLIMTNIVVERRRLKMRTV